MKIHKFKDSLERSHEAEDLPFWEECYRNAFGNAFRAMVSHREDGEWQRAGIDRSVILANSKQLLVDEKVRWKAYDDIALEYMSNDRYETPGWVCKPLRADYIAYAIAPKGICYLLPVLQLQKAWQERGDEWIRLANEQEGQPDREYRICRAPNDGYWTLSVAVPVKVLFPAIGAALRVRFTPVQSEAVA